MAAWPRLALFGLALLGLECATVFPWPGLDRPTLVVGLIAQGVVYAAAALTMIRAQTRAGRRGLAVVLVVAAALRLLVVVPEPIWSDDLYRYIWDGQVQAAGINPYRYIPSDPALSALRDDDVYPSINRRDSARTIYPPLAQMFFLGATRIAAHASAMKWALVACEAAGIWGLLLVLRRIGRPAHHVLLYAWHPLPVFEIAGSGHIDGLMVGLLPWVLLAALERRRWATGATLAGATLTKFFPLVLAPALWRPRPWRNPDWRMPAAFALTAASLYAPYLSVGIGVFGYLPGYTHEENFVDAGGQGFWAVDALRSWAGIDVPPVAYLALCGCILAGLAIAALLRPDEDAAMLRWCRNLGVASVVAFAPHYAWYFVWPIALLAASPWWPGFWPSLAAPLLYWDPLNGRVPLWAGAVIYGGFLVLLMGDLLRVRPRPRVGARHEYHLAP